MSMLRADDFAMLRMLLLSLDISVL